ncbi:MAG TPA: cytochrome c oxidase subunit 3 family protein [Oligoflexia bacterium]|nr:cytochrome c oxidase subunit 3 family protein [Oligoflexia bacterium]HMP26919.1 cytochrome c oxidase subunit 3 family protein [Oligoflexia bacterium]
MSSVAQHGTTDFGSMDTAPEHRAPPHVHHMDAVTAYHAAKLGMWLFLATEILLFAVLFTAFAIFKWYYFAEFHAASKELNWKLGMFNTAVLLFSSFTAALAVDAAQHGQNRKVVKNLFISIACGGIFLIVKAIEYGAKYSHGMFIGGEHFHQFSNFLSIYYCLTGLHALHVVIGMIVLFWASTKAMRRMYSPVYYTPVELGALYWHLVDLIWIYLFPLLYLIG